MAQDLEIKNDLLAFDWEATGEENDFFGVGGTGNPPTPAPEKKELPKPEDEEEEEQEEEEQQFFEEEEEGKKAKPAKQPGKTTTEDEPSIYTDLYKDLKESGLFKHVVVEEDEDIDSDRFIEIQNEEYEAEVSERLQSWATKDLDDDAKAFIKFKRDGGSTVDFFRTYSNVSDIPEGVITDEDYQDKVIRYQLTQEGWDKDEIEDRLAYLTDSDKKEKIAKKYDEKIKEKKNQEKQAILTQQEAAKTAAREQESEFKETLKESLDEVNEIKGFKITPQDKVNILNFLTKKQHKVSDSKSITGFQKKLAETFQDTDKMILLAKLIESDFDMSGFEKATTTKKVKEVKTNLEQRKSLRPTGSGSSSGGSALASLFD